MSPSTSDVAVSTGGSSLVYATYRQQYRQRRPACAVVSTQAAQKYDYDLVIVGAGVGGHGAAMHAVESVSFCLKLFL